MLIAKKIEKCGGKPDYSGKIPMKEIIVYEMSFNGKLMCPTNIPCVSFQEKYWNEYMQIYNECFYEMRKDLDIEPYNF